MLNYFYIFNGHLYTCSYQNRPKYTNPSYHYRELLSNQLSHIYIKLYTHTDTRARSSTSNEYFYCSYAIAAAVVFYMWCSSLFIDRFFFLLSSNCDNKFMQRFAYILCSHITFFRRWSLHNRKITALHHSRIAGLRTI